MTMIRVRKRPVRTLTALVGVGALALTAACGPAAAASHAAPGARQSTRPVSGTTPAAHAAKPVARSRPAAASASVSPAASASDTAHRRAPGKRTSGVAAPGCPGRPGPGRTAHATARSPFVPGHPVVATACRYPGTTAAPTGERVLRGAALAAIVTDLNHQSPIITMHTCPIGGAVHLVLFAYRNGTVNRVHVADTGCHTASNGRRTISAPADLPHRLG